MTVSTRKVLVRSLAAAGVLGAPLALTGQTTSARPASVALTVVVPERTPSEPRSAAVSTTVLRRSEMMLDVETSLAIADRNASRVEVRLGASWTQRARVLVQNRDGEFQLLAADLPVTAAVLRGESTDARSRLIFRLQSDTPIANSVAVPVEYRVTVGEGDQIAVWTFPAVLEIAHKQ